MVQDSVLSHKTRVKDAKSNAPVLLSLHRRQKFSKITISDVTYGREAALM